MLQMATAPAVDVAMAMALEVEVTMVVNMINIPDICHFFTQAKFLENKIYTKKRVNYDKIHSKLPIFCVIMAKYTVDQHFGLP